MILDKTLIKHYLKQKPSAASSAARTMIPFSVLSLDAGFHHRPVPNLGFCF
jgi:hypothetical protein